MSVQTDPGLQPQRTSLAWGRTSLAMLVNAMLVFRAGVESGDTVTLAAALVLAFVTLALWAGGAWRRKALERERFQALRARLAAFTAAGVAFAAATAVWSMVGR